MPSRLACALLLLLGVPGCLGLESIWVSITAAHTGCPESEVRIFDSQRGFASRSWKASCRGRTFHCIGISGGRDATPHYSCQPEVAAAPGAGEARAVGPAAPAGCQYDNQCKGNRVCNDGRCVDPSAPAADPRRSEPSAAAAPPPAGTGPARPSFAESMGITLGDASAHAAALGLKVTEGAVILTIKPDGAARWRNLRVGDVILELGPSAVKTAADVHRLAWPPRPGVTLLIVVHRQGRPFPFSMRF